MQNQLNKDEFEKYFFHGMENKEQVVKWIIMKTAERLQGTHKELDSDTGKTRYEQDKEEMLKLIVQLERFTTKHDKPKHNKPKHDASLNREYFYEDTVHPVPCPIASLPSHEEYFYDDITIESEQIKEMFERIAMEIEKYGALSFVKYRPVSGIFFNTQSYPKNIAMYSAREYLGWLKYSENTNWGEAVYEILLYLEELERENKQEYYTLFLDTKYGRAIDRKTDEDKIELYDEREMPEIRNVYRKFLKRSTSFWCGY